MKLDWSSKRVRGAVFVAGHLAAFAMIFGSVFLPTQEFFADRDARTEYNSRDSRAWRRRKQASMQWRVKSMRRHRAGSSSLAPAKDWSAPTSNASEGFCRVGRCSCAIGPKPATKAGRDLRQHPGPSQSNTWDRGARPYLFIASANMKLALPAGRPNTAEEPTVQVQLDVFAPMQIEGRSP
jgi:hypothetical protein